MEELIIQIDNIIQEYKDRQPHCMSRSESALIEQIVEDLDFVKGQMFNVTFFDSADEQPPEGPYERFGTRGYFSN